MSRSPRRRRCSWLELWTWLALICAVGSFGAWAAQPQVGSAATELAGKAKALELRGRTELARETWEQILQQDPGNAEALRGVIRALRAAGRPAEAATYVAKLRAAHPEDPGAAEAGPAGRVTTGSANPEPGTAGAGAPGREATGRGAGDRESPVREAERLYREGRFAEATAAYRKLYGANPPPGEVALHYYVAEGATEEGRPEAIASLRALVDRFPREARYRRALGALLVGNARTAEEGEKLLGAKGATRQMAGLAKPAGLERLSSPASVSAPVEPRAEAPPDVRAADGGGRNATPAGVEDRIAEAGTAPVPRPAPLVLARPAKPAVAGALHGTDRGTDAVTTPASAPGSRPGSPPPGSTITVASAPVAAADVARPAAGAGTEAATKANEGETLAGYAALKGGRLKGAELKFKVALARDPENGRALGGLGLVRLRQSAWAEAAGLLAQAEQRGAGEPAIARGLEQARAGAGMSGAGGAVVANGGAPGARSRLSGGVPERVPERVSSRPLDLAQVSERRGSDTAKALSLGGATPAALRPAEESAGLMAVAPQVQVTNAGPAPMAGGKSEKAVAGESSEARRSSAAGPDMAVVPSAVPAKARATPARAAEEGASTVALAGTASEWKSPEVSRPAVLESVETGSGRASLVAALHARGEDAEALKELDRMPGSERETALRSPEFAVTLAAIQESQGRPDAARLVLETLLTGADGGAALKASGSGSESGAAKGLTAAAAGVGYGPAQLALGNLLLKQGKSAQAYVWFRAALASEFGSAQAWAGLLASLEASGHHAEVLTQMEAVPTGVRTQMESNGQFLQTATLAYAGVNAKAQAILYWSRLQQYAAENQVALPAGLSIAFAQWLGRAEDEKNLYPVLMGLGSRTDLSDGQRRSVQRIWTAWAVRQAIRASRGGDAERARTTLSAASIAFADDAEALRTIARGYVAVNEPRAAMAVFHGQDLSQASAEDLTAAVGAALATKDTKDAELWLRAGLPRFRSDADLLMLASRYEQETGHARESAAYLRAALSVTPGSAGAVDGGAGLAATKERAGRVEVASAEVPGEASRGVLSGSPNLADLFTKGRAASMGPGSGTAEGTRPYLPSFAGSAAGVTAAASAQR